MSAIAVAKKDFRDAVRSRTLLALTALFGLFTVSGAYLASWAAEVLDGGAETTLDLIIALQTPAGYLVPIIALVVSYAAIAGERESGSLKFLLGLPHSRRDVVVGKILGRTGVVGVSILVGFAVGLIGLFAFVGSVLLVDYLGFTLVTLLFGLVYVCIGVGLSSMTRSTTKAAIGAFGLIVFFWFAWSILVQLLLYAVEGQFLLEEFPDWYVTLLSLSPDAAYGSALGAVLGESGLTMSGMYGSTDELPLAARPWFGFVVLGVWALVPLVIGILRFESIDL
ncbi:ABC transporter permease subunit [Natronococcus sp. A-GB7]|uniref:ABC transporter permease subunit n=1 Tax=Natronococcus sp. A-GB7 TaxID=3037649 RepID=UPI00241DD95B|nr:ABC transporter permease subunit [Natronococcus sp. A-GB7]MDG5817948.1 ABC transporter permease subunit [Natronococcus sp. A-GB7]